MNKKLFLFSLGLLAISVISRLMPHIPNMTPIGALALWSGTYGQKRWFIGLPLLAMLISDFIIGFHHTMPYVYGSFLLIYGLGFLLRRNLSLPSVLAGSLTSSVLFFVITNFGVWISGSWYPHTFTGLMQCYTMAIPFFRNTVIGDLFYVAVFYGSYLFAFQTRSIIRSFHV